MTIFDHFVHVRSARYVPFSRVLRWPCPLVSQLLLLLLMAAFIAKNPADGSAGKGADDVLFPWTPDPDKNIYLELGRDFKEPKRCKIRNEKVAGVCVPKSQCDTTGLNTPSLEADTDGACQSDSDAVCCPAQAAYPHLYKKDYLSVCGTSNTQEDDKPQMYIIKGTDAKQHAWPWAVSIQLEVSNRRNHICGGSIISDRHIVTAAHCSVQGAQMLLKAGMKFWAVIGTNNIQTSGRRVQIVRISVYPNYDPKGDIRDDMAVFELKEPLKFDENMRPVCLPIHVDEDYLPGTQVTVAGWGYDYGQLVPGIHDRLQEVTIPLISLSVCNMTYWAEMEMTKKQTTLITEKMFCAGEGGGLTSSQKDACQGDSGGPVVMKQPDNRYSLIGIVTYGHGCGDGVFPGIYTKVSPYLPWIAHIVKQSEKIPPKPIDSVLK